MPQQTLTLEAAARMMDVEEEMVAHWLAIGELPSLGCADVSWCYLRYRQRWRSCHEEKYETKQKEKIMADIGISAEELAARIRDIAPAMNEAWLQVAGDENIWQQRMDGPVYRSTFILGRFRWYRRVRVWWLRRQLGGE